MPSGDSTAPRMRAFARGIGWKMYFPGRVNRRFVAAGRWQDIEDQALDRSAAWLLAVVPRGWLSLGLPVLAPAFVAGHGSSTTLALGLRGTLQAERAFHKPVTGSAYLAGVVIARAQVAPLYHAAIRPEAGWPPQPADVEAAEDV